MVLNGANFHQVAGGVFMAYFLKKSSLKKGLYLQIYESYYNPDKKETSHRSHKALGYVGELIDSGIDDPLLHFSDVVRKMNEDAKIAKLDERDRQISESPEKHLGYFLIRAAYCGLHASRYLDFLQSIRDFRFSISSLIEALVYSRMIEPCSKLQRKSSLRFTEDTIFRMAKYWTGSSSLAASTKRLSKYSAIK